MACDRLECVSPPPVRLRPDNPTYAGAWRERYGYSHGDGMSETHVRELLEGRRRVMRGRGEGYPAWVMDRLNHETTFASRVSPGRGLEAPPFHRASCGDPPTLPLSTASLSTNPVRRRFSALRDGRRGVFAARPRRLKQ